MTATELSHENHVINDDNAVGNALKNIVDLGWSDFETMMSYLGLFIAVLTKGNSLKKLKVVKV